VRRRLVKTIDGRRRPILKGYGVTAMIRNIILDMGNVLIEFKPLDYLTQIIAERTVAEKVYQEMICKNEWRELDRGAIGEAEALAAISARIPAYAGYVEQFMNGWFKKLKPVAGMEEMIGALKQQGYRIYLLSNASPRIYEYMEQLPAIRFFDGYLISCDIQVNKPDQEIYRALLRKYGLVAGECLFIDDLEENIDGAKRAGLQGYVFKGADDLRRYFCERRILELSSGVPSCDA
jgi:putative hydrolase of the HAD superfamily